MSSWKWGSRRWTPNQGDELFTCTHGRVRFSGIGRSPLGWFLGIMEWSKFRLWLSGRMDPSSCRTDPADEFQERTASLTTRIKSTMEDFTWEIHTCRQMLRSWTCWVTLNPASPALLWSFHHASYGRLHTSSGHWSFRVSFSGEWFFASEEDDGVNFWNKATFLHQATYLSR